MTITPAAGQVVVNSVSPALTLSTRADAVNLDSTGMMRAYLVCTDDPDIEPHNSWTYQFRGDWAGAPTVTCPVPMVDVDPETGLMPPLNLSTVVSRASVSGVLITKGAPGAPGAGIAAIDPDGTVHLTDGSTVSWELPPAIADDAAVAELVVSETETAAAVTSRIREVGDGTYAPAVIPNLVDSDALMVSPKVLAISKLKTSFDGIKVAASAGNFTPIWSDKDFIYVIQPVTVGGSEITQAARLSKVTGEAVEITSVPASQHDYSLGHRNGSICVDRNGYVIQHGQSHNASWAGRVSNAPQTLSPRSIIPALTGGAATSYRRFFRNPYTGDIWMILRGDNYLARLYKWNETTKAFDSRGPNPLSAIGAYGHGIAFGPGVMYCCPEFRSNSETAQSGYPRRDIGLVKCYDDGNTWLKMDGTPIDGPFSPENITVIYPRRPGADVLTQGAHTAASSALVVASDGSPVVVATWMNPAHDSEYMALYASKVDEYTGKIKRQRLFQPEPTWQSGVPQAAYTADGWIVIIAAERHGNHPSLVGEEDQNRPPTAVYLYTSRDGERFYRHELASRSGPDNVDAMTSASIDPESIRLDGTLRIFPQFLKAPSRSEVWTVTLPDPPRNLLTQAASAPPIPIIPPDPAPTLEVVTSDSFTGTDGTVSGRTSDATHGGIGMVWATSAGPSFVISGNKLSIPNPASAVLGTLPVSIADGRVSAVIEPASTTALAGIVMRWQPDSSGYVVRTRRSGTADLIVELGVFVAGAFTVLGTAVTLAGVGWTGNTLALDCQGTAIKVFANGSTTPLISQVNGAVTAAGVAGFRCGTGAGAVADDLTISHYVAA
ncbi:BNR-4 repeat-containing protein [Rhodococcus globerulus]|uniref:BNR-4 repeat-containing protein n=1 Tax=Rhodococcus globerulus TaxID=33008 RepID=UPI001C59670D|nr:BNR-4 repeat-containing protein [Rhodococcus globerulus]QXW03991.1 BNR-4 repeat-containing protein [Rhodococcus globerulus]